MRKFAYSFYAFIFATSAYGGSSGTFVDYDGLSNMLIETADMEHMQLKVPPQPLPPIRPWKWDGLYIGGSVGAINANTNFTNNPTDALSLATIQSGVVPSSQSFHKTSDIYGLLVGVNRQIGWQVFGLEGELNGVNLNNLFSSTQNGSTCALATGIPGGFFGTLITTGCGGTTTTSLQEKLDAFAAISLKYGWAFDRWLWYIDGGPAWANLNLNASGQASPSTIPGLVSPTYAGGIHNWFPGYKVGGGVDWAALTTQWGTLVLGGEAYYWNVSHQSFNVIPSLPLSTGYVIDSGTVSGWVTRFRATWLVDNWTLFTP